MIMGYKTRQVDLMYEHDCWGKMEDDVCEKGVNIKIRESSAKEVIGNFLSTRKYQGELPCTIFSNPKMKGLI